MIDEKKLINELIIRREKLRYISIAALHNNMNYVDTVINEINSIIDIINEQPKVAEWIPCSERLPEEEAKEFIKEHLNGIGYLYPCLLTYRRPNTEKINVVRFYYDLYQNWFVNLREEPCEKDRCLAWQPSPEPWEGE